MKPRKAETVAEAAVKKSDQTRETLVLQTCRDTVQHCPPATCYTCRDTTATSCCSTDFQQAMSCRPEKWTATSARTHSSALDPNHRQHCSYDSIITRTK